MAWQVQQHHSILFRLKGISLGWRIYILLGAEYRK